jgi:hypothetical protein
MFAVMPTTQKYLGDELGGLLGAAAFITVYAGSLVSMRLLMVRQRNQLQVLPTSIIVSETCPSCGGGVPVAIGLTSSCPFCEATVVVSGKDQLKIESAVRETVAREKGRARSALRKAAQSGAENAQAILGAISMVSLLPLLFVALPVLVGRAGTLIVGHVLWPASIRDITARNTLEVVSVVVCVVLGITSVVSVVCVAMRKDSKRRKSMGVS